MPFARTELIGFQAGISAMDRAEKAGKRALEIGLARMGSFILNRSQKYVPVETGSLRRSGQVRKVSPDEVIVSYGIANVETTFPGDRPPFYAVFVHENLNASHADPTSAKFLERAIQESVAELRHVPFDIYYTTEVTATGDSLEVIDVGQVNIPSGVKPSRTATRIKD